jgi:hypothetical protein
MSDGGLHTMHRLTASERLLEHANDGSSFVSWRTVSCCNINLCFFIWIENSLAQERKSCFCLIVFLRSGRDGISQHFIETTDFKSELISKWETRKSGFPARMPREGGGIRKGAGKKSGEPWRLA